MTVKDLVLWLVECSETLHPHYTRTQHLAWCSALLAHCVLEQNHKDNIVLTQLRAKIRQLQETPL
jgi:hypothetical protein